MLPKKTGSHFVLKRSGPTKLQCWMRCGQFWSTNPCAGAQKKVGCTIATSSKIWSRVLLSHHYIELHSICYLDFYLFINVMFAWSLFAGGRRSVVLNVMSTEYSAILVWRWINSPSLRWCFHRHSTPTSWRCTVTFKEFHNCKLWWAKEERFVVY